MKLFVLVVMSACAILAQGLSVEKDVSIAKRLKEVLTEGSAEKRQYRCNGKWTGWCKSKGYPDECCYNAGLVCEMVKGKDYGRCVKHKKHVATPCAGAHYGYCKTAKYPDHCCPGTGLVCQMVKGTDYGRCVKGKAPVVSKPDVNKPSWTSCGGHNGYCGRWNNQAYPHCCSHAGLVCVLENGQSWGRCQHHHHTSNVHIHQHVHIHTKCRGYLGSCAHSSHCCGSYSCRKSLCR